MDDTPDTALAQALQTLVGVRVVAAFCIALASVVAMAGVSLPMLPDVVAGLLEAAIMAVLAFAAYRYFLTDGREVLSLSAILAAPAFVLLLQLEIFVTLLIQIIGGLFQVSAVPGFAVAVLWVLFLVGLARYGTVFPAAVMGGDASLEAAQARGTTRPLVWRLLAAQLLLIFMISSLILLPGTAFERGFGVGEKLGLAIMTPFSVALSGFGTVLVAVILSKAYQGRYSL